MRPALRLALLLLAALAAAQDSATTRLIPASPAPGQPFRLEIAVATPADDPTGPALRVGAELPLIEDIPLRFSGQRLGGFGSRGTTTVVLSGTAPIAPGEHRIPPFTLTFAVRKVRVPATTFVVRPLAAGESLGLVTARLELPDRPLYIGETVAGRVVAAHGEKERVVAIFGVEARGDGVAFRTRGAGSEAEGMAAEFELTPTRVGEVDFRLSAVVLAETAGAATAGSRDRPVVLARKVRVAAIPERGRPADWAGAVGVFEAGPVVVSRPRPEIGEPIRLSVTLRGEGNLDRIVPPEVPHGDAWDVLPVREPGRSGRGGDERTFTYQITPRLPGKLETPSVRLSAFNPTSRTFDRIVFTPRTVEVTGQAPERVELVSADPGAPAVTSAGATALPAAPVSRLLPPPKALASTGSAVPLAGPALALANLGGLVALLGAVGWAARREWVAAHPAQVARARGRRAVARALRRLRGADAARLDAVAVEGLRAGAAPLLAGSGPALTAEDVLRALEGAKVDPATVRAAFHRLEGGRFGGAPAAAPPPGARDALALILRELHRRLCA